MAKIKKDVKERKEIIADLNSLGEFSQEMEDMTTAELSDTLEALVDAEVKDGSASKKVDDNPEDVIKVTPKQDSIFTGGRLRYKGENFRKIRKNFNPGIMKIVEVLQRAK